MEHSWAKWADRLTDGLVILSRAGEVSRCNGAARRILDHEGGAAQIFELMPLAERVHARWSWEHELGERATSLTLLMGTAQRPEVPLEWRFTLHDQEVFLQLRDLDEVSQEVIRQKLALRSLYEETPVMLHSIDARGRLIQVSELWLEKLGYEREEVLGRKSSEFLTPESQKLATKTLKEYMDKGWCKDVPYQFVAKDGRLLDVMLSATSERNARGEISRSFAFLLDITEYQRATARLHDTIEAQSKDLVKQNKLLMDKNRELERFAFIASHDLQEPLRRIRNFSTLLQEEMAQQNYEEAQEYLERVIDGTASMQQLIRDVLQYSRSLNVEATRAEVSLLTVLERTLERGGWPANTLILPAQDVRVMGHEELLTQVFTNLIGNALKYVASGERAQVEVALLPQGEQVRVEVRDNGIGIEPKYQHKIFELFQRLHNRKVYEGTGIGLAICKQIVGLHGGEIGVESVSGEGSTFWFTLELA